MDVCFNCPSCAEQLAADEGSHGQTVSCPKCGAVMVVPQRVVGVPARRMKVAVGVGLGILVVAAALTALLFRQSGQPTDNGIATSTSPERTSEKTPVPAAIEAVATPLEQVRRAADRLARTNHGWLVTHPSDRKSGNARLDTMGNVDGATDGTITHFKLSFGF